MAANENEHEMETINTDEREDLLPGGMARGTDRVVISWCRRCGALRRAVTNVIVLVDNKQEVSRREETTWRAVGTKSSLWS